MTITPSELWAETVLGTGAALLYGASTGGNGAMVKRAVFTNVTSGPITITVNKVPSAGSVAAGNVVTHVYSIAAGVAYVPQELINMVLPPGAALWALASSGAAINTTGSGFTF